MTEQEGYSKLEQSEESMFVLGTFVFLPIGATIAMIILFSLYQQRKEILVSNKRAYQFAILSIVCSLLMYITSMFFCNNLIIPWQYDGKHQSFVEITDSIENLFFIPGKIAFYCSFTYHLLAIFDKKSKTRKCLTIWMIVASLLLLLLAFLFMVDDIAEKSMKEIGVTSPHNIYLTMYVGHTGTTYESLIMLIVLFIDVLYFVILIYFYIKQLKITQEKKENGTKAVVLIWCSCLIYWVVLFTVFGMSSFRWLYCFDVISDDICLFLMFERQSKLYQFCCKGCNNCCTKCIYGSNGNEYGAVSQQTDDNEADNQALI